jgi:erythrocyte band 7 integral membrane protein
VIEQPEQAISNVHPYGDAKYSAEDGFGIFGGFLIVLSYILIFIGFPFSLCCCLRVIQEYQRSVVFRLGRILNGGSKGPGLFFILPCIDNIVTVDLRTITFDVPPQEILTKDSVTVSVDAVVYFRIFDPVASVTNVENANYSTRLLAATTLRNILGTKTLQDVLQDRESLAHHMQVRIFVTKKKLQINLHGLLNQGNSR